MIKIIEIEDEYYMFHLPTSYFTRFDEEPYFKHNVEYKRYHLRKPTFKYKFNVYIHQSEPILDIRTPTHCSVSQETLASNAINLSFESVTEVFTHDIKVFF
jgi:hypothetical protein